MILNLGILRTAHDLASHASQRQSVIAANIANADTPGYRARDIKPFADTFADTPGNSPNRVTRLGHQSFGNMGAGAADAVIVADGEVSPNGNSVSLELEMTKAAKLRNDYDMALGVYRKSIDILRASLGK